MTTNGPPTTACARPGCNNPIARRAGPGRPAIYCSPDCRPKRNRNARTAKTRSDVDQPVTDAHRPRPEPPARGPRRAGTVAIEVDNPDTSPDGRPVSRVWTVRLRKDHRTVTVADGLGWPSANALARQLDDLLAPHPNAADPTTS